jgi:hypothetical protein
MGEVLRVTELLLAWLVVTGRAEACQHG